MNESAQRCEEQIISLFHDRETLVCQGWILKKMGSSLLVYPLYYKVSQNNIPENIRKCEEISRRSGLDCVFRIAEHTNYHLSSILTGNGYRLEKCGVVGEWNITERAVNLCGLKKPQASLFLRREAGGEDIEYTLADAGTVIGIKRQELLFLPDGNLLCGGIENLLQFGMEDGVTRILADIPGKEELPEQYGRAGFRRAYRYRCYQKEEKSSKEQEN